jgi:hypothetical protein
VRKLLIVVLVIVGLAVVGDRVAEHLAEDEVASVVKDREDLPSEPDVEFHGFPFLTQVLANDLTKVTMTLPEVDPQVGDTEQVRVEDVRVTFFDVRTSDTFHRATAARMTGGALIPYDAISALGPFSAEYAGRSDEGVGLVRLSPDDDQALPIDLSLEVGVDVTPDGGFTFLGADGSAQSIPVPKNLRPLLGNLVESPHQLYGLPSTFTVRSLDVTPEGVELTLAGSDVELTR